MEEDKKIEDELVSEEVQQDEQQEELSELDQLKAQCEEYKLGWLRAQADYQNLQKEVVENRSMLVRMSELQVLEEFIPVYDNFKKSMQATDGVNEEDVEQYVKHMKNWQTGVTYIMKQFADILKNHEVEEIKTVNEEFNPELHEAMSEEESDKKSGVILKEIDAGYTMKGKTIKPAKVVVAK
jgi:molecular chaperone GrpE